MKIVTHKKKQEKKKKKVKYIFISNKIGGHKLASG